MDNSELTRREVLEQLGKFGERKLSELKLHCRDFEQYLLTNYDYRVSKISFLKSEGRKWNAKR
jgi:hypothetical protein